MTQKIQEAKLAVHDYEVQIKQLEIKKLEDALFDGHPLVSGSCINITLQELLKICPRKRRRKDSFQGLQKSLNKMGVTLNIKSRKNEKSLVNG